MNSSRHSARALHRCAPPVRGASCCQAALPALVVLGAESRGRSECKPWQRCCEVSSHKAPSFAARNAGSSGQPPFGAAGIIPRTVYLPLPSAAAAGQCGEARRSSTFLSHSFAYRAVLRSTEIQGPALQWHFDNDRHLEEGWHLKEQKGF